MVHQADIQLKTRQHGEVHDLTGSVADLVRESGVKRGLAHVSNIGSTGSIVNTRQD